MTVRILPGAMADIRVIKDYIAQDSPDAARNWQVAINEKCRRLGDTPGIGVARPEVIPGIRSFPVGSYLIIYRESASAVEIIRILHGARQWQDLL